MLDRECKRSCYTRIGCKRRTSCLLFKIKCQRTRDSFYITQFQCTCTHTSARCSRIVVFPVKNYTKRVHYIAICDSEVMRQVSYNKTTIKGLLLLGIYLDIVSLPSTQHVVSCPLYIQRTCWLYLDVTYVVMPFLCNLCFHNFHNYTCSTSLPLYHELYCVCEFRTNCHESLNKLAFWVQIHELSEAYITIIKLMQYK